MSTYGPMQGCRLDIQECLTYASIMRKYYKDRKSVSVWHEPAFVDQALKAVLSSLHEVHMEKFEEIFVFLWIFYCKSHLLSLSTRQCGFEETFLM